MHCRYCSILIFQRSYSPDKLDTSSSLGTYITHAVDVDIILVNDQVPFAEVQLTAQHNVLANEQHHTEQSEPIYDTYLLEKVDSNTTSDSTNISHRGGEIDQDAKQYQVKSPLLKAELFKTKEMIEKETYNELSHRFSPNESSDVHEKPNTPRSCLRWKPTCRIFKTTGLRWIPTGKMFTDNTTKVDNEHLNASNGPAPQRKERYINSGLVQNPVSPTPYVPPPNKDYEILFQLLFDEYFNPPPRAVSLDPVAIAAQELLIQPVHLHQLPLIKMYHLLVLHQQIKKFNLKSLIMVLKN
ncbi:hypothetical protein Tco_0627202 [Tanacetum coccineum]|uniref:Uncharacterized protein n=1 Tax=Tanacetum coccineum TaxID=301880 RepID=A0ABQ4WLU8_9ASTR